MTPDLRLYDLFAGDVWQRLWGFLQLCQALELLGFAPEEALYLAAGEPWV